VTGTPHDNGAKQRASKRIMTTEREREREMGREREVEGAVRCRLRPSMGSVLGHTSAGRGPYLDDEGRREFWFLFTLSLEGPPSWHVIIVYFGRVSRAEAPELEPPDVHCGPWPVTSH
jgi:hypothetical protein